MTRSVWSELPSGGAPYEGDRQRIATWALGAFVWLYVAVPFAQSFQRSGRLRRPYPELFEHSWNNFFVGLVQRPSREPSGRCSGCGERSSI